MIGFLTHHIKKIFSILQKCSKVNIRQKNNGLFLLTLNFNITLNVMCHIELKQKRNDKYQFIQFITLFSRPNYELI